MAGIPQFEQAMKALSAKFSGELPYKLDEIQELFRAAAHDAGGGVALNRLYRTLHSLAGAAKTFGHPHITDAARRFEQCVADLIKSGAFDTSAIAALQQFMDELLNTCTEQKAA